MKSNRVYCPLFVLVAMFFALVDANASAQNVYTTSEGISVEIKLKTEKTVLFLNEPNYLSLEIVPDGQNQFEFVKCGGYVPDIVKVTVLKSTGESVPQLEPKRPLVGIAPVAKDDCSPYDPRYFLPELVAFKTPGTYSLTFEKEGEIRNRKTGARTPLTITAHLTLEVAQRTAENTGKVVEEYGQRLLKEDQDFDDVLRKLIAIRDRRAVPYFAQVLKAHLYEPQVDENNYDTELGGRLSLACQSAAALSCFGDAEALKALQEAMESPNDTIRLRVAHAFLTSERLDQRGLLMRMWNDPYFRVRYEVAEVLAVLPSSEETEEILNRLLKDEHPDVRAAAQYSREHRKPPPQP